MKQREYTWFVEPLDAHTNKVVSGDLPVENAGAYLCVDGQHYNLWRCSSPKVQALWRSRETLGLKLKIWVKEGNGVIREKTFLFREKGIKARAHGATS